MFQAFIFDFDGILADTEELHYRSFQTVLEPLRAGFDWETYLSEYIAFDSSQVFARALQTAEVDPAPSLTDLIDQKVEAFQELLLAAEIQPLAGAVEAVTLAHAEGPVALCTGAERRDVAPLLAAFGLTDRFRAVVTADDVAISKPDPECYRMAAALLEIPAEQCLAIEDTPGGLQAARGAGCQTLGVATTHTMDQLRPFADRVVDSLERFPEILRAK